MASLMENLIDVLNKEISEYEVLLALSRRKTPAIIQRELDALQKITDDEQMAVAGINHLDKQREEITKDIANVLNKDVNKLTISELIRLMSPRPEEAKELAKVHDKLKSVVGDLKIVNKQNEELLKNSLEMVEFELNLLQATKAAPETANYNKGAYSSGDTYGYSTGGFDAKQ